MGHRLAHPALRRPPPLTWAFYTGRCQGRSLDGDDVATALEQSRGVGVCVRRYRKRGVVRQGPAYAESFGTPLVSVQVLETLTEVASELPAVEGFYGRTARSAIFPRARNTRFENARCSDHGLRDSAEWYLQPATPARVSLACVRADVDVDEPLAGRPLDEGTHHGRHRRVAVGFDTYAELEVQIFPCRSLPLDRFVRAAPTFLQAEVHAPWRPLENNAKRQFTYHIARV